MPDWMVWGILFLPCLFLVNFTFATTFIWYKEIETSDLACIFHEWCPFIWQQFQWPCDLDFTLKLKKHFYYTPVFRLGTYNSMVMSVRPGLRPSDSPSIRVSVRQFSTLFSNMLWHIELKFCIWLCFTVLQIKFECRQFASILVGVMPLLEFRILELHSFPHFSLTCFGILSWNFAYDFVLLVKFCRSYASFGT